MLDTTPDLICLLGHDLVYMSVNKAYARAFGATPREMAGRHLKEFHWLQEHEHQLEENFLRCLAGERVDFGLWASLPELGRRYWNTTYMPFVEDSGVVAGVLIHARDATARQEALEESRYKGQIIHDTLQSMHQGLLMMDATGQVTLFNERLFRLMDLPSDFFDRHKTFDELLAWWRVRLELDDEWLAKAREQAVRPEPLRFEIPGPRGATIEVRHRPLKQGGFVRTFTDVSQRKEAELALRHARDQLEYLVEVRTRELEQTVADLEREISRRKVVEQELLEARNAAQSANAAKTQFLANMSHELRTPLNGILGVAQLLLGDSLSAQQREFVEIMRQSSNELLRLLNDLLELASIEQGATEPKYGYFSLRKTLDPLLRTFEGQARGRGLRFVRMLHEDVPDMLNGDANRLKQVVYNLLGNALKFTEEGCVSFEVRLLRGPAREAAREKRGANALALLFSVKDTGIGIADSQQERVFERFLLGEDFLTKRFGGSGIGLSIAKELVDMMQGRMWVESESGKGSTFYFWLPFLSAERASEETVPQGVDQQPLGAYPQAGQGEWRILVAEDEPVNRLFIKRALERMGFVCLTAENGRRALELLAEEHVDLVIMDVQMPECNGLEATRRIRDGEVPGLDPAIPVVGLTAYAMESDRQRGLEAGMNGYVTKPCSLEDLRASIDQMLHSPA